MADTFDTFTKSPSGPYHNIVAITAADTDLTNDIVKLYIQTTGTLIITTTGGQTVTMSGVPTGSYLEGVSIRRIAAASTAAGLVGFY